MARFNKLTDFSDVVKFTRHAIWNDMLLPLEAHNSKKNNYNKNEIHMTMKKTYYTSNSSKETSHSMQGLLNTSFAKLNVLLIG